MTVLTAIATSAHAETFSNTTVVNGSVVNSVPHYHTKSVSVPTQKCSIKEIPIYSSRKGNSAGEGALGGMILGGILGKVIGGNDQGAAAGAILGGVIGADKSKPQRREIIGYRQDEVCKTVYRTEDRQVQQGWTTTVKYNGHIITQKTNRRFYAGQNVKIRLSASIMDK